VQILTSTFGRRLRGSRDAAPPSPTRPPCRARGG